VIQNGKAGMMTNSLIQAIQQSVICNRTVSTDSAATKQERRYADLQKDGRTFVKKGGGGGGGKQKKLGNVRNGV
jgi:hypothetical protein